MWVHGRKWVWFECAPNVRYLYLGTPKVPPSYGEFCLLEVLAESLHGRRVHLRESRILRPTMFTMFVMHMFARLAYANDLMRTTLCRIEISKEQKGANESSNDAVDEVRS